MMKYAIVESGGKQYRAVEGGTLEIDRLPLEPGANVKLEQVLLLADGENITVGMPVVKDSPVWTTVLEHFKGEKVTIFNYSPKKRIRVKTGHRQNYTRLLVEQIGGTDLIKKEPVKAAKVVVEEAKVETKKTTKPAPVKTDAKKAVKAAKPAPAKTKATASPKGKTATKPASKKTEPVKKTTKTSPAKPTKTPAKKTAKK
jgi:large subunit ribosomal protein L21